MPRRHAVAAVIVDGFMPFEVAVASEVFDAERSHLDDSWYEFKVCAVGDKPTGARAGLSVHTPYGLEEIASADTIIVTPTRSRVYPGELLAALVRAHERGARLVSLCTGAFILAAAGILDGKRVTTHWENATELADAYPGVEVDASVLYVDDGDILTSAGTAASIDLCLYLVRQDFGAEVANAVARSMVVPPHRDGGQAQYIDHPIDEQLPGDLFAETLAWAELNLASAITVEELARRSAMSPRTFARRFTQTTGTTPHHWLTHQRVQLAQRMLESTDKSIDFIASECGFGSATNLRAHFRRDVNTTPSQYRRTFGVHQPS